MASDLSGSDRDALYLSLRRWTVAKYGLTPETYDEHTAQGGRCAICGNEENVRRGTRLKRLAIDHDRHTGRLRDLLCNRCNVALGLFKDDPDTLLRAAEYIVRHRGEVG